MRVILVENMTQLNELVPTDGVVVQVQNVGSFIMNESGEWEKIQIYNE